ncbi:hypothetical protein FB566_3970 [Stackebrandtia endophytica]|uniref:Uncharacterized protein n=1 Tax=Stackebrandtia endophytica TaxID=1496996 RepID=A0A543B0N3_9ACTN|nr:hypothetical protein FB566_3970 [Stackebrandtia endophytica]
MAAAAPRFSERFRFGVRTPAKPPACLFLHAPSSKQPYRHHQVVTPRCHRWCPFWTPMLAMIRSGRLGSRVGRSLFRVSLCLDACFLGLVPEYLWFECHTCGHKTRHLVPVGPGGFRVKGRESMGGTAVQSARLHAAEFSSDGRINAEPRARQVGGPPFLGDAYRKRTERDLKRGLPRPMPRMWIVCRPGHHDALAKALGRPGEHSAESWDANSRRCRKAQADIASTGMSPRHRLRIESADMVGTSSSSMDCRDWRILSSPASFSVCTRRYAPTVTSSCNICEPEHYGNGFAQRPWKEDWA